MRPCLEPGCPKLTNETRCEAHRKAYWRTRQRTRDPLPVRIYASAEWKQLARAVVDSATCCHWCSARGEKLTADHIRPVAQYPALALELSNVVAACRSCQTRRSWESGARDA